MEDYVKDAILVNEFSDLVLLRLVNITMRSIISGRPLFQSVLDEPVFFRDYFQTWVQEAMEEKKRMQPQEEDE